MNLGRVEAIHLAPVHGGPPEPRERVAGAPGCGLEGDRHFGEAAADITLVEAEALEGLASDTGIELPPGASRRNVTVRGADLNSLVGKHFQLGGVECVGEELCEPCRHLESLTAPGVLRGLVHRGGLCARIVRGGEIAVGDELVELP
jgi:MOSC domain-containing protein YiiM